MLGHGREVLHKGHPPLGAKSLQTWQTQSQPDRDVFKCRVVCSGQRAMAFQGLGGIIFAPGQLPVAAARELVDALRAHKTQIIPLELMAAAGMIVTYAEILSVEDKMFFNDNQSVCCALVQGCSRSWDIQLLSTAWQLMCIQTGCRIWIEWVPSGSNPADILSRKGTSCFVRQGLEK